jgi:hypothetical protein
MPNSLTKNLEIMFGEVIDGFENETVISNEAEKGAPNTTDMQRAGDTYWRPQTYQATTVSGLDISAAAANDIIQRQVPTTFGNPENVYNQINALEMRDASHLEQLGKAAAQALAGKVDMAVYDEVAKKATIVQRKVGALSAADGAQAEAQLLLRGVTTNDLKLFINPNDYIDITQNLGNRDFMSDWTKDAYARSRVPDIARFKTFRTQNLVALPAVGNVSGTTVAGVTAHTITAMTGNLPTDNRYGTLGIAGANIANIKNGDAFTITGVNAVDNITKASTNRPMTFRVISGGGTNVLTISPKIVPTGQYQNVTAAAATGAAMTFLNTSTQAVNPFWSQGAVTIDYGKVAFQNDAGVKVIHATTPKNKIPIVMVAQMNALTGVMSVRYTIHYAVNVIDPEKCGIILANQI